MGYETPAFKTILFQYRELWELLHCGGFCSFKTGIPSGFGLYGYQYAGYAQ